MVPSTGKDVVHKDVVPLVEGVTVAGNAVALVEDGVAAPTTEATGTGAVTDDTGADVDAVIDDNGAAADGEGSAEEVTSRDHPSDVASGKVWLSKAGPVTRT